MNYKSIALVKGDYEHSLNIGQKLSLTIGTMGAIALFLPLTSAWIPSLLLIVGILSYTYVTYNGTLPGIKNNHVWQHSLSNKGILAWVLAIAFVILASTLLRFGCRRH
jgi:uncharacterized membrane protein HdeD (DUF308 family)